jgi:hypothetical protein
MIESGALLRLQGIGFVFFEDAPWARVDVDSDLGCWGFYGNAAVDAEQYAGWVREGDSILPPISRWRQLICELPQPSARGRKVTASAAAEAAKVVRGSAAWRVKWIMFIDLSSQGSLSRLEVSFAGHVPALLFLESAPSGTTGQRAKVMKMRWYARAFRRLINYLIDRWIIDRISNSM